MGQTRQINSTGQPVRLCFRFRLIRIVRLQQSACPSELYAAASPVLVSFQTARDLH